MSLVIYLLLSGVFTICDGLRVLGASDPLTVELKGSVVLPCYVEDPIPLGELEVEWKKIDTQDLVHLFQDGESRPESQGHDYIGRASFFTEEIKHGNFSLLLTNLTLKDSGVYNCSVYTQQESGQTSAEIKEIEHLIVVGSHAVSANMGEDVTLDCSVVSHIQPEKLEVSWKKIHQQISVLLYQDGEVQTYSSHQNYMDRVEFFSPEEIHKGNFSLRLKNLQTGDRGMYICEVFSEELSANTTVDVRPLGFSRMHLWILSLCGLAFVSPVLLSCLAYCCTSKVALYSQYALVICPNITISLAFILWGVTEGFFIEAEICFVLNFLRIIFLFGIAPYQEKFNESIQRLFKNSAITTDYAVITAFAYIGFLAKLFQDYELLNPILVLAFALLLLVFIAVCMKVLGIRGSIVKRRSLNYLGTTLVNCFRVFAIMTKAFKNAYLVIVVLPFLQLFVAVIGFLNFICRRKNRVFIWMSVLLLLEILSTALSIYVYFVSLENYKERVALTCVNAYLYVLTLIILFEFLFHFYGHYINTRTRHPLGHVSVYMLGAVAPVFVNSVALAVELILKAQKGERTVEDLTVIVIPSECVFALCCLTQQLFAFFQGRGGSGANPESMDGTSVHHRAEVPVHNHELQTLNQS
ncbi:uncharacterized protein [Hoplias malabaricus]|uniref:uncharacterized protein n=1 Tax=Hoplias malabaricus TaxID=27720 RepID=UPI0034620BE7